jgi:hypothetical protein
MADAPAPAATPHAASPAAEEPRLRLKVKKPRQRACDQRDDSINLPAKDKVCCGHLKRWFDYPEEVARLVREECAKNGWSWVNAAPPELYRCEICRTLYIPDPREMPRSYTHRY